MTGSDWRRGLTLAALALVVWAGSAGSASAQQYPPCVETVSGAYLLQANPFGQTYTFTIVLSMPPGLPAHGTCTAGIAFPESGWTENFGYQGGPVNLFVPFTYTQTI